MKRIWFRVGMEAEIDDALFDTLVRYSKNGDMLSVMDMMEVIIKNGELSGETYIVGKNNGGVDNYDNPDEEISVLF